MPTPDRFEDGRLTIRAELTSDPAAPVFLLAGSGPATATLVRFGPPAESTIVSANTYGLPSRRHLIEVARTTEETLRSLYDITDAKVGAATVAQLAADLQDPGLPRRSARRHLRSVRCRRQAAQNPSGAPTARRPGRRTRWCFAP